MEERVAEHRKFKLSAANHWKINFFKKTTVLRTLIKIEYKMLPRVILFLFALK